MYIVPTERQNAPEIAMTLFGVSLNYCKIPHVASIVQVSFRMGSCEKDRLDSESVSVLSILEPNGSDWRTEDIFSLRIGGVVLRRGKI